MAPWDDLVTPALGLGILAGVTRAVLLELAPQLGYEVEEGTYTLADVLAAEEAFTSSSVREVLPVSEVDATPIPFGDAGSGAAGGAPRSRLRMRDCGMRL